VEARARLPRILFEYIEGGAYSEETLRRNVEDLSHLSLRQRVLRDVSRVDLSCHLFAEDISMPVALGPVGLAGMYARREEVASGAGRGECRRSILFVFGWYLLDT